MTFRERSKHPWAHLYSLIEPATLCGVEPRTYLGEAARLVIRSPEAVTLAGDLK